MLLRSLSCRLLRASIARPTRSLSLVTEPTRFTAEGAEPLTAEQQEEFDQLYEQYLNEQQSTTKVDLFLH
jgi:hypothetical protein